MKFKTLVDFASWNLLKEDDKVYEEEILEIKAKYGDAVTEDQIEGNTQISIFMVIFGLILWSFLAENVPFRPFMTCLLKILFIEFMEIFKSVDIDGNGRIEKNELQIAFSKTLGREASEVEVENMFKAVDMNDDGKISFDEYFTIIHVTLNADKEMQKLIDAFEVSQLSSISD